MTGMYVLVRKILILSLFLLLPVSKINAQEQLEGKAYRAQISEICKEFENGGCTLRVYRLLEFGKDSVNITYKVTADCVPEELGGNYEKLYDNLTEKHKWTVEGDHVIIDGFSEYGTLVIQEEKLIGVLNLGNREFKSLEFVEIPSSEDSGADNP